MTDLTNVFWISGGTGAGKTSIATALAERHGIERYNYDWHDSRSHSERTRADRHPSRTAFLAMSTTSSRPSSVRSGWLANIAPVPTTLTPMLTVKDSAKAVDFCKRAFGATEGRRVANQSGQAVVQLWIEGNELYVVDENPAGHNLSPSTLGGTSVRISLVVDDPDALFNRAIAAGAKEVFPLADQPYGMRQGRVADPEGHHWLIGKVL